MATQPYQSHSKLTQNQIATGNKNGVKNAYPIQANDQTSEFSAAPKGVSQVRRITG